MADRYDEPSTGGPGAGDEPAAESWMDLGSQEFDLPLNPQLLWKDRAGFDVVVVYVGGTDQDALVVPIQSGLTDRADWLRRLSGELLDRAPRIEWTEAHEGTVGLTDVSRSFGINLLGPPPGPPTTPPPPWFRLRW